MFLKNEDGINISVSTLHRHLKSLFRRKAQSDVPDVALFLQEELNQHRMLHGYNAFEMHPVWFGSDSENCTPQILDPQGAPLRQQNRLRRRLYTNPGPNFLWHVDSYDKLKPYRICINSVVDGFLI